MKMLVTGGAGFIGANFIIYWLKKYPNDQIVNLDALTYAGNLDNLEEIDHNSNYQFIKGDIGDEKIVRQAMQGVNVVVHFAAESHVDRSILDPTIFVRTNVLGTQVLLEAARQVQVERFHHVSTDEVFGELDLTTDKKFNEDTMYDPRSPYAASKAGADYLVRAYYHTYNLPMTISNCSNNFGPFQFPEKLIPLAITNILEGKQVPIYGDGKNVRDWLYVEDHCRAIDLILKKGRVGETYCVGGLTTDISNLEIVKKIVKLMGKDETVIKFVKDRPGHDRKYSIDWAKINQQLGWQPDYDFDTYLRLTINWYQDHQGWWQKLKGRKFMEYYQKQYGN